jgi:hypothetical protein
MSMLAIFTLLAMLSGGMVACGGNQHGTGGIIDPGTTPGSYTITVTGTSGALTASNTINLTVLP